MYKFLSTGLVLIGALLLNASAMANQGSSMQNSNTETQAVMSSMDQSATCIVANCRSRLQSAPSQASANLSTSEISSGLARPITVISSLDQSATCVVANCRSRLQPAPTHPSV